MYRYKKMAASEQTVTRAKKFMEILNALNEQIFDIQGKINDNEYLTMMNQTKQLYDLRNQLNTMTQTIISLNNNEIVREENRRSNLMIKKFTRVSEANGLKNGTHEVCKICNRVVAKTYMAEHKNKEICRKTREIRKVSMDTQSLETEKYAETIVRIQGVKQKIANREEQN